MIERNKEQIASDWETARTNSMKKETLPKKISTSVMRLIHIRKMDGNNRKNN